MHQLSDDSIMRYPFEKARRSFARRQQRYKRNIRNQTEQHFISAT